MKSAPDWFGRSVSAIVCSGRAGGAAMADHERQAAAQGGIIRCWHVLRLDAAMMLIPAATHTTAANTDRKEFVTFLSQSMRDDQGRVNQC